MNQKEFNQVVEGFLQNLKINKQRAQQKKQQYLQRIMQIFREFVRKCQAQIDKIIQRKILKLQRNYFRVQQYFELEKDLQTQAQQLIISQFLVKPFEKFPFSGNKNQKIFKQQYSLIEKATLLIEQTLVDSFNQEQIPNFDNTKFFQSIRNNGIGQQSLIKLNASQSDISLQYFQDLVPLQKNVKSLKMFANTLALVGDSNFIQIWDLQYCLCIKKLELDVLTPISTLGVLVVDGLYLLAIGFAQANSQIWIYRSDNWQLYGCTRSHTRNLTKIIQAGQWMLSGSTDGNVCLYDLNPFKNIHSSPHISSIDDLIYKNNLVYVLLKCSSLCQYELFESENDVTFHFRRTLSSGYISMIRYTELGSNFAGVSCHIYGLSQIQITRKFRVQQTNIINVPQMIADFVIVESKQNSEYYALCAFQNSSAVRIYSLKRGQAIFEVESDYLGEAGVAGYMPKVQITCVKGQYWVLIINQSQFDVANTVKMYKLRI